MLSMKKWYILISEDLSLGLKTGSLWQLFCTANLTWPLILFCDTLMQYGPYCMAQYCIAHAVKDQDKIDDGAGLQLSEFIAHFRRFFSIYKRWTRITTCPKYVYAIMKTKCTQMQCILKRTVEYSCRKTRNIRKRTVNPVIIEVLCCQISLY